MHAARIGPNLIRHTDPVDASVAENGNPVSEVKGLVVIVGDVDRSKI